MILKTSGDSTALDAKVNRSYSFRKDHDCHLRYLSGQNFTALSA